MPRASMPPAPAAHAMYTIKYEKYTVNELGECFVDMQLERFHCVVDFLNAKFSAHLEPSADLASILAVLEAYKGQILECDFCNPDAPGTVYSFRAHGEGEL